MTSFQQGEGVTESERYLQRLARRSFLSLWCYGGVFRNQGRHNGKGDGKEVADLLVIFGDDVLIFSDKYCEYPATQDEALDWKRWYKKAVRKSADQLWGAERVILTQQDKLYKDRACTIPFPLPLPEPTNAKIHRIAVAHGAADRCRAYFGSGSGSLLFSSSVVGDEAPFTIGTIEQGKGFVHVLDDTTLDIVLDTLDTITDFVNYLTRKEQFFASVPHIFVAGEEDLLAYYLQRTNESGDHDFTVPERFGHVDDYSGIGIAEGFWEEFSQNPQRKAQIAANEISYLWDRLIDKFSEHAIAGTQYYTTKPGIEDSELILRFLAREPRFIRRILSQSLFEVVINAPNPSISGIAAKYSRIMPPLRYGDPYYIFLTVSWPPSQSEEVYRESRRYWLNAHCVVAKLIYPGAEDIVGIATEPWSGSDKYQSEDAVYFDARQWNDDLKAEAESLQRELGIWTNITQVDHGVQHEYPLVQKAEKSTGIVTSGRPNAKRQRMAPLSRAVRNSPCPCGSGKKLKNCHGA